MKFSSYLLIFFIFLFLFQSSSSSNLISQSCKEASKNDPNLKYGFCVESLEDASSKLQPPPTNLEGLVCMSTQLTKSNASNMVSIISKLLKDKSYDQYVKACLRDCFDLYSDSLSDLDDAVVAFKQKDFDTAAIKLSASLDNSETCEDQFKEKKGETSPLTKENQVYFQLNMICLAFLQMLRQHY
ncbi:putative invertase inhibitor [Vigna umbellata]|uniref:putative invertase inhibitor n=1 Tax=Vigna umbellata TaxID=87088 RepID=UPI001F5FDD33|nr:putative invertase inhibitor [Vigna umbellata]